MKKFSRHTTALLMVSAISAIALPKCDIIPLIDGVADEVWSQARMFELRNIREGQPLVMQTKASLMYDDNNLYVFVDCREVNLTEARDQQRFERHDAPIWENGCVEIFIDTLNDGRSYYQFVTDIHGDTADLLHHHPDGPKQAIDWNGYWRSAIGTTDDGWTVEAAIPWRTLKVAPGLLPRLGVNISRVRRIAPFERGTLAEGTPQINLLEHFPVFENITITEPEVSAEILPGSVFLGKNRMRLKVKNHTNLSQSGKLELTGTDSDAAAVLQIAQALSLDPEEACEITIDYVVEKPGQLQIAVHFVKNEVGYFLDLADCVFRQTLEVNDSKPIVFAGSDHPLFIRLFTPDDINWSLGLAVYDNEGRLLAETRHDTPERAAFMLAPTASLEPGDYILKLLLMQNGTNDRHERELPLKIIRRL